MMTNLQNIRLRDNAGVQHHILCLDFRIPGKEERILPIFKV